MVTDAEDRYAYLFDLDGDELRDEIIQLARTEGVLSAYLSAIRLCNDPKAPAQAQSNAQRTLLTIGGLMDHRDRPSAITDKEPGEMTGEELQAAVAEYAKTIGKPTTKQPPKRAMASPPPSPFD